MTANFTRGVLVDSSWHGLEEIGTMADAKEMIAHGERVRAWPTHVSTAALMTVAGLKCYRDAVVATYADSSADVVGVVGDKYEPATPEAWRDLIAAAVTAGAKPTGAFSLRNGRVIVATFEVGESNGIRTYFVMVDSFDGSQKFRCGHTSVRVVCCNTLSAAIRSDGHGMAAFRHTSSIHDKIKALTASVGDAIKTGEKVKEMYHAAETFRMDRTNAEKAFDLLFPAAKEDATPNAKTRAENARAAGRIAAAMPINAAGNSLASLWNAATYLVDRTESGDARKLRGGNRLDSMLLGKRGEDVEEILLKIEMIMSNGEIQAMTVPDALASGANPATVGSDILQQMLADAE